MEAFQLNLLKMMMDQYGPEKVKLAIDDLEKNEDPLKKVTKSTKKGAKPKQRITNITAKTLEILENAFANSNTLVVDKALKAEFIEYVNNLSEEAYAASDSLVDHANAFARSKGVTVINEITTTTKPRKVSPEYKEDVEIEILTYDALKEMEKHLSKLKKYPSGIFWNKELNKFVTGPEEADDEEVSVVTFNDKVYHVGDTTHRVYELTDEKDIDGKFVGYYGIDEFKKMNKVV